jgi:putative phage-type endonuclease
MSDQRTAQWFAERCGKVTASRVSDVLAVKRDGKPTAARNRYLAEIVAEQLTGDTGEHFVNRAMQWGIEQEPFARSAYEAKMGVLVDEVGFIPHPTIELAGASPDGLVGTDGLVEIKCPTRETHVETLIRGTADPQYIPQMQWQMACTGRTWCDFVSFDPRFEGKYELFIARVERDDEYIKQMEDGVEAFIEEIAATITRLSGSGDRKKTKPEAVAAGDWHNIL